MLHLGIAPPAQVLHDEHPQDHLDRYRTPSIDERERITFPPVGPYAPKEDVIVEQTIQLGQDRIKLSCQLGTSANKDIGSFRSTSIASCLGQTTDNSLSCSLLQSYFTPPHFAPQTNQKLSTRPIARRRTPGGVSAPQPTAHPD